MSVLSKICLAGLLGCLGAVATQGCREALFALEYALYGITDGHLVAAAEGLPLWRRAVTPALGALGAGLILWAWGKRQRRRGGPPSANDYLDAVRTDNGRLDAPACLIKVLASICVVVTGNSIGREGAMILLAALAASVTAKRLAGYGELKLWTACGVAAGISSAYHAPLAGGLFIAEIFFGEFRLRSIWPAFIASGAAWAITEQFGGVPASLYHLASQDVFTWRHLPLLLGISVLAGFCGPLYLKALHAGENFFSALRLSAPLRLALGGLLVGGLSVIRPEVWGNGYSSVQILLLTAPVLSVAVTLLLFKLTAIVASSGSGAPGGIFTPTLFMGAALGSLVGTTALVCFPQIGGELVPSAALTGMAALLAAVAHAPGMAALLACELTGSYLPLPWLLVICLLSGKIARRLYQGGIYDR